MHECKQCMLVVLNGTKCLGNVLLKWCYCLSRGLTTCVPLSNGGRWKKQPSFNVSPLFMNLLFWLHIIFFFSRIRHPPPLLFHLEWSLSQQESSWIEMKRGGTGVAWRIGWQKWALNRSIPCVFQSLFFFLSRVNHSYSSPRGPRSPAALCGR